MKSKLEVFNDVLREIQNICVIFFLLFGCAFFLYGIVYLSSRPREVKPLHEVVEPVVEVIEVEEEQAVEEKPLTREEIMFAEYEELSKITDKKEWYLVYKGFIEDYPEFDRGSTLYDRYKEDEIYMMQRVIETETYGCDFEAKSHVASVILNRIEGDNNFPNDAIKVCTSPGQFVYGRKNISEDTKLALEYAAEIEDTTNGALYFNSMAPMDSWNGRERIFTDHVGHSFY